MWSSSKSTIDSKMLYMAVALSQNIVTRIGEVVSEGPYVDKQGQPKKTDHRFHLHELTLEDSEGRSYQVDSYSSIIPPPIIVYFRLDAVSTKTSKRVVVRAKPYHYFLGGTVTAREVQFFEDFLIWLQISGVHDLDKPVFSRLHPGTGRYAEAQGRDFRQALKDMAVHFELDPIYYSGKSTRKGGATSMHVSGRSDADILGLVGHQQLSTTVEHYISNVGHRGNTFSNADQSQVTIAQLRRNLPIYSRKIGVPDPSTLSSVNNRTAKSVDSDF
jgi:hypothetical protein